MANIIAKLKKASIINKNEATVYPINEEGKQCGAMKINSSLLEEIDENKLYRISFNNSVVGYDNVAAITGIEQVNDDTTVNQNLFQVTGTVTDIKDFEKGRLITVTDSNGNTLKGGAWKNLWQDYSSIESISIGTTVEFFGELAVHNNTQTVRYNFHPFQERAKQAVKNLITKRYNVSDNAAKTTKTTKTTTTDATMVVKNAQTEMQKLVDKLAQKGWIVENAPKTPCVAIGFQATVNSTTNALNIIDIRALEAILQSDILQQVSKKLFSLKKGVDVEYKSCKEQLPAFVPMGQVNSKQRTNETCSSNGLVFLDVDNIEFALCEKILSYIKENEALNSKILLWNLSPSRKGFHLVFTPFSDVEATIVANQKHICTLINTALGCEIEPDASCTQFSKASFITSEYWLGGAALLLSIDNPTVLPTIETGVVYIPAAKEKVIKRTKTADGLPFEAGENPNIDDISVYIDVEDFQTLKVFSRFNKYVETNRNNWWTKLGARFRSKGYTQTWAEPIFDYAMEYVQLLPEYKYTVDDPINSTEAWDAFMWAFKKENWEHYIAIPSTIADEDLPLGLRKSTSVTDFIERFAELEDDLPELFRNNSNTFFDAEKNLHLLPFQIMSTAELCTSYTSGVIHTDYNGETLKNALQMIFVASSGDGKSSVTKNNKLGFGKILYDEFNYYMTSEFNDDSNHSTCTTLPNATNAKVKDEIFRAYKNNMETPVIHTQCSEMGLFRKQQNSPHGGLDFEMMKNGWDGDTFNCATKSKDGVSGFVDSLHLSTLISATPMAVQEYTPKAAITDGTVNRLCFCFAQADDDEQEPMVQTYDSEAIARYVEWARKQRGAIYLEEIFGDEAKAKKNNIWSPYLKLKKVDGYGYISDLIKRTSVNAKRVVREYYLMDLYEKGYNLVEHEGKTKVIKDNIITDLPKAEPWLIQLMKVSYEYLVFGVHTLFGERAARIHARSKTKTPKKLMYKEVYDALPERFTREQLETTALNIKGIKNIGKNLVTNWNKNQVWSFDAATKMYTKI